MQCLGLASCSHTKRPSRRPRRSWYRCRHGSGRRNLWVENRRSGRHQVVGIRLWELSTMPGRRRCMLHFSKDFRVRLSQCRVRKSNTLRGGLNSYYYPGTFQQYAIAPAHYATPIPDGVPSDLAAPLLCGGVTVYAALKKLIEEGARPGDWVVIPGEHIPGRYGAMFHFQCSGSS